MTHQTRSAILCIVFVGVLALNASAQDGWKPLFDGKSLDGWKVNSGFATYNVEDGGVIAGKTAKGSSNSFLCPPTQYGNFILEFEVKVDDGLNSGVQIRSKLKNIDAKNSYGGQVFGPQVEIESSPGQSGFVYGEATGRGWLSQEPQSKDKAVNQHSHMKNGQWNKFRIVAEGDNIKTSINGNAVADLTDAEIYKTHPKGLIGLQVHGIKDGTGPFEVRWRNLRIKALK